MKVKFILVSCIFLLKITSLFAQEHNVIYIYHDDGVSEESLNHTLSSFKSLLPKYQVKTINAMEVIHGTWKKDAALFVMPGGADLPYVKKLSSKGVEQIKEYVSLGGAYLGLCAGAYFASSFIEFDKNGPLEVVGGRELNFFKGKSIGPILATYDYKSNAGARASKISTNMPDLKNAIVFYNGGGFFNNPNEFNNVKVIANYDNSKDNHNYGKNNNLAAIILISHGKGLVMLSGVHFEYNPYLLDNKDEYLKEFIPTLKKNYENNKLLFIKLMNMLNLY